MTTSPHTGRMDNPFRVGGSQETFSRVCSCVATLGYDVQPLRGIEVAWVMSRFWLTADC